MDALRRRLSACGSLLVAFSGGVDSSFLLAVAAQELPGKVLAVTVRSPLNPESEMAIAREQAAHIGAPHLFVDLDPLADEGVVNNLPDRCYHCKRAIFSRLRQIAADRGIAHIAHGENADDAGDFRPGKRAAAEMGIAAPLAEVGLTRREIRQLSREIGLPNWDRPSMACLASRVPYGTPLTLEVLQQIARAEEALREVQPGQLRVRHHGPAARIEVPADQIARLADPHLRGEIVRRVKLAGYNYVTLDLEGFRSGSANEVL
ncbi:MAG: ATP-dependent sacrificial sulfur transferase LarE [Armatimonadetes bacterium]|nr:ATP-dependent sacrificial sulfur transferase LarE [Armatimonadota bacterium]